MAQLTPTQIAQAAEERYPTLNIGEYNNTIESNNVGWQDYKIAQLDERKKFIAAIEWYISVNTAALSQQPEPVKSAEEVLDKYFHRSTTNWNETVIRAMKDISSQFHKAADGQAGVQWVKASDRLPDNEKLWMYLRIHSATIKPFRLGIGYYLKETKCFYTDRNEFYTIDFIEWLYEPVTTP